MGDNIMRIAKRTLLTLLMSLALAAVAFAQGNKPTIGRVEVVIKDINTKQDIAIVEPGGTVELPAGSRVRLIMSALPTGSASGPKYPATTFSDLSKAGGGVTITRSNAENSTADLVIGHAKGGNRTETIRYQITDTWVPANLRTGNFTIRVVPGSGTSTGSTGTTGTSTSIADRAEQLTRLLYQGILLRDPDPGAQGSIDAIRTGGYDALVKVAVGMANSEESRARLGSTPPEQRLASLYQIFLGINREQADPQQWQSDLNLMNQGRIADVVSGIVQSDRFRERNNLVGVRY
ncbi:MAG TPA: hypothetical protein VHC97_06960 [Thermoanaerobaculia bacterium]|jgi:hypothetical protein|nr:hypothetical protein [Thermoanaerobaculia bacterium]